MKQHTTCLLGAVLALTVQTAATAPKSAPAPQQSPAITTLSIVPVYVTDLDAALTFYRDTLGFQVIGDLRFPRDDRPAQTYRWIMVAPTPDGTSLVLTGPDQPTWSKALVGRWTGYGFITPDIQDSYERLAARGVHFRGKPETHSWGGTEAIFTDPDGNQFILAQHPAHPRGK
jgi:catechol 2,3-dioxygenase-like lactoylglutathione lyase family enzyme